MNLINETDIRNFFLISKNLHYEYKFALRIFIILLSLVDAIVRMGNAENSIQSKT